MEGGTLALVYRLLISGRSQIVILDDAASQWAPVTLAVPQDSPLGPVLFVLFVMIRQVSYRKAINLLSTQTTPKSSVLCRL